MPVEGGIKITGLREVSVAFKRVDSDLPKELQRHFKDIAENVADRARGKVPRLTGKAAGSIRPRATQKGAAIAFSDSDGSVPYFPWLNFGGRVGRNHSIERSVPSPDAYIYSTIAQEREEIGRQSEAAVEVVSEKAGFETRG